ncbi:MAG: hypothetical protein AAGJ37_12630 [Pseudomonadota bacterium]
MTTLSNHASISEATVISLPNTTVFYSSIITPLSHHRSVGWWCNLCQDYKLDSKHPHQIVVKQQAASQFDIMVKLIKYGTCEVIFYDCELTRQQSLYLENLTKNRPIQLINARKLQFSSQKIA